MEKFRVEMAAGARDEGIPGEMRYREKGSRREGWISGEAETGEGPG